MNEQSQPRLLDRIMNVTSLWRDMRHGDALQLQSQDLSGSDLDRVRGQFNACLEARGGEVSARHRAAALGEAYLSLDNEGRRRFLLLLADEFGPDRALIDRCIADVAAAGDDARHAAERRLAEALEPRRMKLLTQFTALPEGVKFLVDMRAEMLALKKSEPRLAAPEEDLKRLLAAWFEVGFLEFHRLTWQSPAAILEKIMAYEAVHEIESWQDLRNRLDSDRRLFAFLHPGMPNEPLIFVEVALVQGMAGNIQTLLDQHAPSEDPGLADTAIFYSISNAQPGLAGISFGDFLIKRCVTELRREFPNLKTFATLSPIPGFRRWLERRFADGERGMILPAERKALKALPGSGSGRGKLKAIVEQADWYADSDKVAAAKAPLMRLCAKYLLEEKRVGKEGAPHLARDPVAHFHLSNGARMERLNWLGDTSQKGLKQSAGLMINYLYRLSDIEKNHEAYRGDGKIAAAPGVKSLL